MPREYCLVLHTTEIRAALDAGVAVMIGDKPYWAGFTLTTAHGPYGYCCEHGDKEPCPQCAAENEYWDQMQK